VLLEQPLVIADGHPVVPGWAGQRHGLGQGRGRALSHALIAEKIRSNINARAWLN
jgi:hypothetical protein